MRTKHPAFWRYTAFQVPGWLLAAGVGWWLQRHAGVPAWAAAGLPLAWVVKDYALYPFLRFAYEADERRPIERLIGAEGAAVERLAPAGYVRVRGELWRARHVAADDAVATGGRVAVVGIRGTTLLVRPLALTPAETARDRFPESPPARSNSTAS